MQAYVHHVSDFVRSGFDAGFEIERLDEWKHAEDTQKALRLLTLLLRKGASGDAPS